MSMASGLFIPEISQVLSSSRPNKEWIHRSRIPDPTNGQSLVDLDFFWVNDMNKMFFFSHFCGHEVHVFIFPIETTMIWSSRQLCSTQKFDFYGGSL